MIDTLCRAVAVVAALLPVTAVAQLPGPLGRVDEYTVALGTFDDSVAFQGPSGTNLFKSTASRHPVGMFQTSALSMPSAGGVSVHSTGGFDVAEGTIEMWVRRGLLTPSHQTLLSVQGVTTLDGGPYQALIVGEVSMSGPAMSKVLYHGPQGLQPAEAAHFRTSMPRGISVGDIDGDGVRDLVASMHAGDRVDAYLGPLVAGNTYTSPALSLPVPDPQGNTLADLDGDGDLDLLVCSYEATTAPIYGFENQGDGSFSSLGLDFLGLTAFAEGMAVGDLDIDGVLDVLFASLDTAVPSATLLGHLDEGRWGVDLTDNDAYSSLSFVCLGAGLADVDRDGWLDAVLTRPLHDQVVVHLNQGDGSFRTGPDMIVATAAPFTVAANKDVDNDGYLDIVTANWHTATEGSFSSKVHLGPDYVETRDFPVENAVSLSLGDLDGDGWLDLFLRSSSALTSRLYYLDVDGFVQGSQALSTSPSDLGSVHGPGVGVFSAVSGGTMSYSSSLDRANGFELFLEDGQVHFRVTDERNRPHAVSLPFPSEFGESGGYRHVRAEWSLAEGLLDLRVLPSNGSGEATYLAGAPIEMGWIAPQFRLGTDFDNQRACRSCRFDDVRISNVRRSQETTP